MTTPFFPHLLIAVRNWCYQNTIGCHITVPTENVTGLPQHIINRFPEEITLDISEGAIANFSIDPDNLHFNCRFNAVDCFIMMETNKIITVQSNDGQIVCLNPSFDPYQKEEPVKEETKPQSKLRIVE